MNETREPGPYDNYKKLIASASTITMVDELITFYGMLMDYERLIELLKNKAKRGPTDEIREAIKKKNSVKDVYDFIYDELRKRNA